MDMLIEDCLWASFLAHTAYPEVATPPRKLLPVFPFWPLLKSKDHKAAPCSLLAILQSRPHPIFNSNPHQNRRCSHMWSRTQSKSAFSFVVKIWSQAQQKGYGKSTQDKTLKSASGCMLVLTKQGPKHQEAVGPWERGPTQPRCVTHSPTSQLVPAVSAALRQWPWSNCPLFLSGFVFNTLFWPAPSPQISSSSKCRRNTPGITGFSQTELTF